MKQILTFLAIFFPFILISQNQIIGKVKDGNGIAISYAHVFLLENQNIGTVTNEAGEFQFYLYDYHLKDTLVVSMLGFETQFIPLIKHKDLPVEIILEDSAVQFNEVVIHSPEYLKYLLISAIEHVERNYPNDDHQLHGYYYDYTVSDTVVSEVIEMDVAINIEGYNSKNIEYDIYNLAMRKSEDNRNLPERLKGGQNRIFHVLNSIPFIRKSFKYYNFRKSKKYSEVISDIKSASLEMFNQVVQDGDTLITIKYYDNSLMTVKNAKPLLFSLVTVNKSDFAIVKVLYGNVWESENSFNEVSFRRINGKYFPTYLKLNSQFNFDQKTKYHFNSSNIIIYNSQIDEDYFIKTKRKQRLKKEINLRDIRFDQKDEFWKKYSLTRKLSFKDIMQSNVQRIKKIKFRSQ